MGGREFLTTVTPDAMRNFARGYGDDNPLFITEEYGTTTRWGGQIAAPMIPIALNRPLFGDPHAERIKRPSFRGIHVFVSGSSVAVVPAAAGRRRALQLRRAPSRSWRRSPSSPSARCS